MIQNRRDTRTPLKPQAQTTSMPFHTTTPTKKLPAHPNFFNSVLAWQTHANPLTSLYPSKHTLTIGHSMTAPALKI